MWTGKEFSYMVRLYNGVVRVDAPCPANVLRIDLGCMPMVAEMNANGILIDKAKFAALDHKLADEEFVNQDAIESMAGWRCNPNSGDQVARLLFGDLHLESPLGPRMTAKRTRPAVDDDILSSLLSAHPIVPLIQTGRSLTKLRGTYTTKMPGMAWPDGRIRTTLRMNVARTGRMASEDPNLQNVPVASGIRDCFVAPPGRVLGAVDLSQIELAWAAELSGDSTMCQAFVLGQDLHVITACGLFRLDFDRVLSLWKRYKAKELTGDDLAFIRAFEMEQRLPSKTLNFATLYGTTPAGLQAQILSAGGPLWQVLECGSYIDDWFDLYGGVRDWMSLQHSRVQRYGMNWTAFGRWRLIGEAMSSVPRVRSAGLRQAGNHPVQGSAGDHLKIGMAEIIPLVAYYNRLIPRSVLPLLQVHDELIFELHPPIAADFLEETRSILTTCIRPMSIPTRASVAIGGHWGMLK